MGRQRRLKLAKRMAVNLVTGVAWYRRDQWTDLRTVSADPENLEETYDEWLTYATDAISKMERDGGIKAQAVDIDVDELVRWCRERQRPIDQAARAAFTSFKLRQQHEAGR